MGLRFQVLAASLAAVALSLLLGGAVAARLRLDESDEALRCEAVRIAQAASAVEPGEPGETAEALSEPIAEALMERERAVRRTASVLGQYSLLTALVLLLLLYASLTFLIVRPVDALRRAADRIDQATGARAPSRGPREIAALAASINRMAARQEEARRALEERFEALERAHRELLLAQDQVARSERLASVGRLSAGVAHEIGNPLAAIQGLLELARDDAPEPELLTRAIAETERIKRIVRGLLDHARVERDEDGAPVPGDVASAVSAAVELLAPQKDLRGIRIETDLPEEIPLVAMSQDALTQLLLNLLLNAADALGERGGEVRVRVTLPPGAGAGQASTEARPAVRLVVEDDGAGIAADALPQIFAPFFTTKRAGRGTGLGLSVVETLVHRAGGEIRAENRAEGGARFLVELPPAVSRDHAGRTA